MAKILMQKFWKAPRHSWRYISFTYNGHKHYICIPPEFYSTTVSLAISKLKTYYTYYWTISNTCHYNPYRLIKLILKFIWVKSLFEINTFIWFYCSFSFEFLKLLSFRLEITKLFENQEVQKLWGANEHCVMIHVACCGTFWTYCTQSKLYRIHFYWRIKNDKIHLIFETLILT